MRSPPISTATGGRQGGFDPALNVTAQARRLAAHKVDEIEKRGRLVDDVARLGDAAEVSVEKYTAGSTDASEVESSTLLGAHFSCLPDQFANLSAVTVGRACCQDEVSEFLVVQKEYSRCNFSCRVFGSKKSAAVPVERLAECRQNVRSPHIVISFPPIAKIIGVEARERSGIYVDDAPLFFGSANDPSGRIAHVAPELFRRGWLYQVGEFCVGLEAAFKERKCVDNSTVQSLAESTALRDLIKQLESNRALKLPSSRLTTLSFVYRGAQKRRQLWERALRDSHITFISVGQTSNDLVSRSDGGLSVFAAGYGIKPPWFMKYRWNQGRRHNSVNGGSGWCRPYCCTSAAPQPFFRRSGEIKAMCGHTPPRTFFPPPASTMICRGPVPDYELNIEG